MRCITTYHPLIASELGCWVVAGMSRWFSATLTPAQREEEALESLFVKNLLLQLTNHPIQTGANVEHPISLFILIILWSNTGCACEATLAEGQHCHSGGPQCLTGKSTGLMPVVESFLASLYSPASQLSLRTHFADDLLQLLECSLFCYVHLQKWSGWPLNLCSVMTSLILHCSKIDETSATDQRGNLSSLLAFSQLLQSYSSCCEPPDLHWSWTACQILNKLWTFYP